MANRGTVVLILALVLFLAFFANVSSGAAGQGVVLGDVAEMLTLFGAAILFVIGVLLREAADRRENKTDQ